MKGYLFGYSLYIYLEKVQIINYNSSQIFIWHKAK